MKQVKCVITDDEPTACEGLQRYVEKVDFLSLMGVCEDTMQCLIFRGLNSWHLLPIRLM